MSKKFIMFLILLSIIISACSTQQEPVGKGTPVPSPSLNVPADGEKVVEKVVEKTTPEEKANVKEFEIIAKQFEFIPETIEVNQGDKVKLVITSVDVKHGYAIDEYGIDEKIIPGQPTVIEFTADKKGTFTSYCSVFCGSGHSRMKGTLIVK